MALPLINVIVRLTGQGGAPQQGSVVIARLSKVDADLSSGMIVPTVTSGITDAAGHVTLPLWPNNLGKTDSEYLFTFNSKEEGIRAYGPVTVTDAYSPVFLSNLGEAAVLPPTGDADYGLVTENPTIFLDYGLIADLPTTFIDFGSITE